MLKIIARPTKRILLLMGSLNAGAAIVLALEAPELQDIPVIASFFAVGAMNAVLGINHIVSGLRSVAPKAPVADAA